MKNSKGKIQEKKGTTSLQLKLDFKEVKPQSNHWKKLKAKAKYLAKEMAKEAIKEVVKSLIKEFITWIIS